jgi:hypothetical protein
MARDARPATERPAALEPKLVEVRRGTAKEKQGNMAAQTRFKKKKPASLF